jgi:putative transposase
VSRIEQRKLKLRWRVSGGPRRSLGWIPFKASAIRYRNGQVIFAGTPLCLWDSYGLARYDLGAGNISEDARGRWYLNLTVKVKKKPKPATRDVESSTSLDLGLKDFAATRDGYVYGRRQLPAHAWGQIWIPAWLPEPFATRAWLRDR